MELKLTRITAKQTAIALTSLLLLGQTQAGEVDIPNSFTAGTPARAAEVNENFAALEAAIDDNAAQLNALTQPPPGATPIEVVQQNAMINDQVDINGELLTITSLPFARMDDDVNYVIEYPDTSNADTYGGRSLTTTWTQGPTKLGPSASDIAAYEFTLDGFPALLRQTYNQAQNCSSNGCAAPVVFQISTLAVQVGPETLLIFSSRQSFDSVGTRDERQAELDAVLDLLPYFEIRPE